MDNSDHNEPIDDGLKELFDMIVNLENTLMK